MVSIEGLLKKLVPEKKRVSPAFTFVNTGSISGSGIARMDLELGSGNFSTNASAWEYQKHMPFVNMSILNNNVDYNIEVSTDLVPAHATRIPNRGAEVKGELELLRFKVKNLGTGTIGAEEIIITVWNE